MEHIHDITNINTPDISTPSLCFSVLPCTLLSCPQANTDLLSDPLESCIMSSLFPLDSFTTDNDYPLLYIFVCAFCFFLLSYILKYGCTAFCLPVHLLMDICFVFSFWLLQTKLPWKFRYTLLCGQKLLFLLVKKQKNSNNKLKNGVARSYGTFKETTCFPKCFYRICILTFSIWFGCST